MSLGARAPTAHKLWTKKKEQSKTERAKKETAAKF